MLVHTCTRTLTQCRVGRNGQTVTVVRKSKWKFDGHDEMPVMLVNGCLGPCKPVKCRGALVRGIQSCMHFIMSGMMLFWLKFVDSYCKQLCERNWKILASALLLLNAVAFGLSGVC